MPPLLRVQPGVFVIAISLILYWVFTISEWLLHRFIMHRPSTYLGKQHLMHHVSTSAHTMRVDRSTPGYAIVLPDENLCLDTESVIYMSVVIVLLSFGVYKLTLNPYYAAYTLCLSVIFGAFVFVVWNSIHPYLHRRDGTDISDFALPARSVYRARNNWYVDAMLRNHIMHHIIKGTSKGNYNIVLPGADWLFGTRNPSSQRAERILATVHAAHRAGGAERTRA